MTRYGLIFDVDGVIADTEAINARASIKAFDDLLGVAGVRREDFEAGLGRGAEEYVRAAARVQGLTLREEQVKALTTARQDNFLTILTEEELPAFEGVLELMGAALADDGFAVAIATSSTREKSEAVLRATGVAYEKMAYITGSDVVNKKPHPELFLRAAERIGVAAQRCAVIEDAPNGVEAAKAAGAKCIAVTNSATAEKLSEADVVVDNLGEVDLAAVVGLIER